jgi:DMSO/TMAO reductase YedYZ molybdopterin-dependent catalytic subunit
MSALSRRKLIVTGLGAVTGASGLAVAARLAKQYGLLPPDSGGLYGPGHCLTYASQRILTGDSLAREFTRSEISAKPFAKQRPFESATFDRLRAGGFAEWKLSVEGMVAKPGTFTIQQIRSLPLSTQITQLTCEEGWNFVAEWAGAQLSHVLRAAEVVNQARYVVYYSMQPRWFHSIHIDEAFHPQTILAYGFNGGDLPFGHGGPLRLRVPRQLGYKNAKFIHRLVVTDSLEAFQRPGSYSWYAGI